jgi:hypothetical protein
MKFSYIISFITIPLLFALLHYSQENLSANSSGSPIGHTGSPFDGRSCTSCHAGPAPEAKAGWITSNIPADGYVAGETYTLTATASRDGSSKFGFQVAAYTASGSQAGTLKTVSSETQIQSAGRYITHTAFGNAGSNNSKTWIFEWTAPGNGLGDVTFYGAFLGANNNGSSSGDVTYTSNLQVRQRTATNVNSNSLGQSELISDLYPNPVTEAFTIKVNLTDAEVLIVQLFDLMGRDMGLLYSDALKNGQQAINLSLPVTITPGIYQVLARTDKSSAIRKIVVR